MRGCGGEAVGAEPQLVYVPAEPGGSAARLLRHSGTSRAGSRLAERREAICPISRPLFPFSSLFPFFPLHLSLVNEKGQRTTKRSKRSKRSSNHSFSSGKRLVLISCLPPPVSPLAKTASRVFSGTGHSGSYPPESIPGYPGGLHYKNYRILERIGQA